MNSEPNANISKPLDEWATEIDAWADSKGWNTPQCSHANFEVETYKTSPYTGNSILWCSDCGAVSLKRGDPWRLPKLAQEKNVGEVFMLFVTEIAEAFEEWRNHKGLNEIYYNDNNPTKPEGIPVELADLMIRIMHFTGHNKIPLESTIRLKQKYNETRPFRHGGKQA